MGFFDKAFLSSVGKAVNNAVEKGMKNVVQPSLEKAAQGLKDYTDRRERARICPSCGAEIDPTSKFCQTCGARIAEETAAPAAATFNVPGRAARNSQNTNSSGGYAAAGNAEGGLYYDDGRSVHVKLLEVLESEFPQYTVRRNVSPTTIGGTGKFMDYSYGVYEGPYPKLFIMIIRNTTCSHRQYRWSKEQAQRAGVTMINFRENEPNSVPYITARLHKYL